MLLRFPRAPLPPALRCAALLCTQLFASQQTTHPPRPSRARPWPVGASCRALSPCPSVAELHADSTPPSEHHVCVCVRECVCPCPSYHVIPSTRCLGENHGNDTMQWAVGSVQRAACRMQVGRATCSLATTIISHRLPTDHQPSSQTDKPPPQASCLVRVRTLRWCGLGALPPSTMYLHASHPLATRPECVASLFCSPHLRTSRSQPDDDQVCQLQKFHHQMHAICTPHLLLQCRPLCRIQHRTA